MKGSAATVLVTELASVLWPTADRLENIMPVFAAYFDESGTHRGSPLTAFAGIVASVRQWEHFDREWKEALSMDSVPAFHMKHFTSSRGHFSSWREDNQRRKGLMQRLIGIIKRRTNTTIGVVIDPSSYEQLIGSDPLRKRYFGSLYAMSVYTCIHLVNGWAEDSRVSTDIGYVFDRGHGNAGEVLRVFNKYAAIDAVAKRQRLGSIAFLDDVRVPGLQAADIVAWELATEAIRSKMDSRRPIRRSFESLREHCNDWRILDGAALEQFADHFRDQYERSHHLIEELS